jgi:RNA polymerase sigma factor (sigma-70 family)
VPAAMTSPRFPELSEERIARALAGDRAAVAELYETYDPAVRSAVVAAIRHRPALEPELEDFVSEIWTRFVADGCWRLRSYDPKRGTFGYYVRMRAFATARALAGKRAHREPTVALTDPLVSLFGDDGLEGRMISRDTLAQLWAALQERLGAEDLLLFQGVFVEGRFVREVAEELGMTESVAFRRTHRLKQKLERIAAEVMGTRAVEAGGGGSGVVLLLASLLAQGMLS